MRNVLRISVIVAALLGLCACNDKNGFDRAFLESDTVSMTCKKEVVFQYDPLTCQLSYNDSRREFRASTDNMSDYFVVRLGASPSEKGQVINGSLSWTGEDYLRNLNNVSFTVEKISGNKVWLWNQLNKVAVVIQMVN